VKRPPIDIAGSWGIVSPDESNIGLPFAMLTLVFPTIAPRDQFNPRGERKRRKEELRRMNSEPS
jgi:hypothetical protein